MDLHAAARISPSRLAARPMMEAACARTASKGGIMTISGELNETDWTVAIETVGVATGGYRCRVHVMIRSSDCKCEHVFPHHRVFATEREAALEGLRSGMTWVEMKKSDTFTY
jgi:hypothetical protein